MVCDRFRIVWKSAEKLEIPVNESGEIPICDLLLADHQIGWFGGNLSHAPSVA
jgi:hypothetical protein